jgi:NADH-quinone oxidoreductase subunit L
MGGLRRYMPLSHATFLVSCLAIAGIPPLSGFFSKDEILFRTLVNRIETYPGMGDLTTTVRVSGFAWPEWLPWVLYIGGVICAVLTAFYMFRLYFLTFWGDFRGWKLVEAAPAGEGEGHGHGHGHHPEPGEPLEGPAPLESPWQMTWPLVALAILAALGGFLNAHPVHLLFGGHPPLDSFVAPVFHMSGTSALPLHVKEVHHAHAFVWPLLGVGVLVALTGSLGAYWVYVMRGGEPAEQLSRTGAGAWLHVQLAGKWWWDEIYEETILGAVNTLAELSAWVDKWLVDGIIARATSFIVSASGQLLRFTQTGRLQAYAAIMVFGVAGVGWYVLAPHPEARVEGTDQSGDYKVVAAPGLGYQYRWDANGDGRWDTEQYLAIPEISFHLERDQSRVVRLGVRNAFGLTSERVVTVARPKEDRTGGDNKMTMIPIKQGADGKPTYAGEPNPAAGRPQP